MGGYSNSLIQVTGANILISGPIGACDMVKVFCTIWTISCDGTKLTYNRTHYFIRIRVSMKPWAVKARQLLWFLATHELLILHD